MRLYSYTVRVDDGAAPNPYGGVCTLAICKPGIRRTAEPGDWIVGLGPTNAPGGQDLSNHVVYAMQVSDKMTYEEYDEYCLAELPVKVPVWKAGEPHEHHVGDCIYHGPWRKERLQQRRGVHNEGNIDVDLRGENVLLAADKFFYFGDQAVKLHEDFGSLRHPYQGYKWKVNEPIKQDVVDWIERGFDVGRRAKVLYGQPLHRGFIKPGSDTATWSVCGGLRAQDRDDDCSVC